MLSDHFPRAARRYSALPLLGSLAADFHTWLLERGFRRGCRKMHFAALPRIDRALRRRGRRQWSDVTHDDLEACWRPCRRRGPTDRWIVRNLERFAEQAAWLPPRTPRPPPASRPSRARTRRCSVSCVVSRPRPSINTSATAAAFLDHIAYEAQPARLASVAPKDIEAFVCQVGARLRRDQSSAHASRSSGAS